MCERGSPVEEVEHADRHDDRDASDGHHRRQIDAWKQKGKSLIHTHILNDEARIRNIPGRRASWIFLYRYI